MEPEGVGIGPVKLDGWEVIAGVGLVCVLVGYLADPDIDWLKWLGAGLIGLWLILVILVLLGVIKPKPANPSEQTP
jgi:hypothetical protein